MGRKRAPITAEFHEAIDGMAPPRRTDALSKIVDLFAGQPEIYNDYQVDAFDDVINRLIALAEEDALKDVAATLAPIPNAPLETLHTLARHDSIEVAGPVLTGSERLSDEFLIEIVQTRGHKFSQAIAKRKTLDPAVTEQLVLRGDKTILRLVAAHREAQISDGGFDQLRRQSTAVGREKRASKRIPARYTVWLNLPDRREPLACELIDISPGGARIRVASVQPLPPKFTIYLARGRQRGRTCSVAWRQADQAGLQFLKM